MSKHTLGPWKIYDCSDGIWIGVENNSYVSNFKGIAKICPLNLDLGNPKIANTHLIRSAPELLEALEKAHLEIIQFLSEGDFKRKVEWDAGYIVDAIAKARGES